MRIWKTAPEVTDRQVVELPEGAKLLSVQMQHGRPCLWALVNELAKIEKIVVAIYGTGNPMPEDPGVYISTFQIPEHGLVFHAFEIPTLTRGVTP